MCDCIHQVDEILTRDRGADLLVTADTPPRMIVATVPADPTAELPSLPAVFCPMCGQAYAAAEEGAE